MPEPGDAHEELLNELAEEFAARQRNGDRPRLEECCDRHPRLARFLMIVPKSAKK